MKSKNILITAKFVIVSVSFFTVCGNEATAQDVFSSEGICIRQEAPDVSIGIDKVEHLLRFQKLTAQWRVERGASSSIEEICTRPAYLGILAMGTDALPLMLDQLEAEQDQPDHWFVALHHITGGVDPVPEEHKGNMQEMAKAWLDWAEQQENAG
jgi:hypothetical protein